MELILDIREVTNVFLATFGLVMTALLLNFLYAQCSRVAAGERMSWYELFTCYRRFDKPALAAIGLAFMMFGEFMRAAVVWELIHFERQEATYTTKATILIISLIFITVGSLCVVRVFSPDGWGSWLWSGALAVAILLSAVALALPSPH